MIKPMWREYEHTDGKKYGGLVNLNSCSSIEIIYPEYSERFPNQKLQIVAYMTTMTILYGNPVTEYTRFILERVSTKEEAINFLKKIQDGNCDV